MKKNKTTDYLALYVFYEQNGEVTPDVVYYLEKLKTVVSEIMVIVNGKITAQGRRILENLKVDILVRENEGMDFGAWKAGLEEIGWNNIEKKDGLLLCNCSCFGPVYPFEEIFSVMEKKECDFWGINRHPELEQYLVPGDPKSKVIEHVQSYFLFFRPSLIKSKHFRKWWDNLVLYSEYEKEVGYHETKFTKYLEDGGYKSATYMDFDKYKKLLRQNASIQCCDIQLIEDRNPLIKKRIFNMEYIGYLYISSGSQVANLMSYIREHTDYDENYIWDWIIKRNKQSTLKKNLHLNWVLPTTEPSSFVRNNRKIALVLYIYYQDLIDYCFRYAQSMPADADVFVIVSNLKMKEQCLQKFKELNCNRLEIRQIKNRGRDVAAYLIAARDVFAKYDYICCVHDKKSPAYGSELTGYNFSEHCFQSTLFNSVYVENIIRIFEQNNRLGMLVPPILNFSLFSVILGCETKMDVHKMQELFERLKLQVPFDTEGVIPFGTMFWVRGKAFLPIFRHDWCYDDFPAEPCPSGGTILHALERVYPFAVQEAGYFVGVAVPDRYASVFIDNQLYMLRELNIRLFAKFGLMPFVDLLGRVTGFPMAYPAFLKSFKGYSKLKYLFYKVLSKITFGQKRKKYKQKRKSWKQRWKELKGVS